MHIKNVTIWSGEEVFYEKNFDESLLLIIDQKGENYFFRSKSSELLISCLKELEDNQFRILEIKFVIANSLKEQVQKSLSALKSKMKGEYFNSAVEVLVKDFPARLFVSAPKVNKVLVVDDSPTIQKVMAKVLEGSSSFTIDHTANNAEEALTYLKSNTPDVMTLDINMPGMSGVDLLKKLGKGNIPPTVLVTGLSMHEGPLVLEALECGALDYIQKPEMSDIDKFKRQLTEKLSVVAASKTSKRGRRLERAQHAKIDLNMDLSRYPSIVAIGASTGGTEAIKNLLKTLPPKFPPIVIVQHIPPVFSKAFADRLNQILPFKVSEAKEGDKVVAGEVLIAPGGLHMRVVKKGQECFVSLDEKTPERSGHRPSVDVLFESVAEQYPQKAIGILLTGMGADGAQGMLAMKNTGSLTLTQDEDSSVVYGMPKKAKLLGASTVELSLLKIGPYACDEIRKRL